MAQEFAPRFPFCVTGDGHIFQIRAKTERMNEEGVEGYDVIINPSQEVIAEYGLKKDDFEESGFISRWYPKTVFKALRDDPVKGMYFLFTDLNGQETSVSRMFAEYGEIIQDKQKHIHTLKARNARLWHEINMMTSQEAEYMRKKVDLMKIAKSLEGAGGDEFTEEPTTEMPG